MWSLLENSQADTGVTDSGNYKALLSQPPSGCKGQEQPWEGSSRNHTGKPAEN